MKLTAELFVTIDGVYQAPGGREEDTSGGFAHGGWTVPYADDESGAFITGVFDRVDAFLLGRRTYDIFAGYWPAVTTPDNPIAARLNSLPKYVVSNTLTSADWHNSHIVNGDLAREVAALKARPGRELQVHGSGALVRSLLALGLIDTLYLFTYPVVLGTGKRFFGEDAMPTAFSLEASTTTKSGVVINTYTKQGAPAYGDFSQEGEAVIAE